MIKMPLSQFQRVYAIYGGHCVDIMIILLIGIISSKKLKDRYCNPHISKLQFINFITMYFLKFNAFLKFDKKFKNEHYFLDAVNHLE